MQVLFNTLFLSFKFSTVLFSATVGKYAFALFDYY